MTTAQLIIGLLFIAVGISSFTNFDIFHYLIPALFIFIGLRIMMGRRWGRGKHYPSVLTQNELNEVAIFSGSEKRVVSTDFAGGKAASIFSGMELDLRDAKIKGKSAELELVAVFGGLRMFVPKEWHVVTEGAGVIGGFTNHTDSKGTVKLVVRGAAIFGGVDIEN